MANLTAIAIKNAPPGKLYDGNGLELVRTESGGRWCWKYTFLGKRREMGLGSYPGISLSEARKERDKWRMVLSTGRDPISVRKAQRADERAAAARADPSLRDLAELVLEAKRETLKDGGEAGRWMSPLETHVFPKIGRIPMSQITQTDVHDAIKPIWRDKHPTAIKAIRRLNIIFRNGKLMGYDCDPFTIDAAKHMLGEVLHHDQPIAATPWQEIPDLFAKLEGKGNVAACLQFMILTLVRASGCRAAAFGEIKDAVWTVPAERMKGRVGAVRDFRVPLSSAAIRIVEQQQQISETLLFPGQRGNPISDNALSKHLTALGEKGRPHGFRTSFRTWVQDTDATSWEVSETILAHTVGGKVERSYARSDLLERRATVMQAWADYVTGESSKIVKIRG